jgi:Protein of unknown function (DUF1573)
MKFATNRNSQPRHRLLFAGTLGLVASCALLLFWQLRLTMLQTDAPGDDVPATEEPQSTVVALTLPDVFVGQPCGVTVPLKNCGDTDLHLHEVKTGCACTQAEVKPHILRSQKTGMLEVSFRGAERPGDFVQRVTLEFDSDSAPDTRVNIFATGNAVDWADIKPNVVDFGQVPIDQPAEALVTVRPAVKGAVSVRALSPRLTVRPIGKSGADRGSLVEYRVTLAVDPRASIGRSRAELEISAAAEGFKPIMVPVFYENKACISAKPERIVLLNAPSNAPTVRFVQLSAADGETPISEPVVSHSLGKVLECTCVRSGRVLRLRVQFRPQAGQRFCSGAISLRFPKCGLSIPFVASVGEAPRVPDRSVAN